MLEELIHIDHQLLLALNGSGVPFWDAFFLLVTKTFPWIFMAVAFVVFLLKNTSWKQALLIIVLFAAVITCSDQFASTLCKPFFHRFRPCHEPALDGLVHLVEGRSGGLYGFISSHAANTFGVVSFVAVVVRRRWLSLSLLCWACLSSYSRIYLGLHYPGDILAGAVCGGLIGLVLGCLNNLLSLRFSRLLSLDKQHHFPQKDALYVAAFFWLTLIVLLILAFCRC